MVEILQKEIKEFIAQSCESYTLTTNKQIKDLAIKIDANYGSMINDITNTEFECILDRELTTDFDIFYEKTADLKLAQLLIDLSFELEISLKEMLEKSENIIIHNFEFEKFVEHKIMEDKIFGNIKLDDLKHFNLEQIWEDKFSKNHYISGFNCIVEFKGL